MCCHIFRNPQDSKSLESSCQAWAYISQPSLPTHLCLNGLNDWFSLKKCEHESSVKMQVIKKQRSLAPSLFHHLPGAERKMCGCRGTWALKDHVHRPYRLYTFRRAASMVMMPGTWKLASDSTSAPSWLLSFHMVTVPYFPSLSS